MSTLAQTLRFAPHDLSRDTRARLLLLQVLHVSVLQPTRFNLCLVISLVIRLVNHLVIHLVTLRALVGGSRSWVTLMPLLCEHALSPVCTTVPTGLITLLLESK